MLRAAIAVGMILVLLGPAIGQNYQPTSGWTGVENAAMGSFWGTLLKEAAKKYLKEGAKKYSKYFVSSILGFIGGFWPREKYCYYMQEEKDQSQDLHAVLIPGATSWQHCQQLARICAAENDHWNVQYSKEIDFPYVKICHEE